MSKISVTTIAGLTSGGDANKVKIESGDTLEVVTNATVGGTLGVTGVSTFSGNIGKVSSGLSPDIDFHIKTASGNPEARVESTGANYATYGLKNSSRAYSTQIRTDQGNAYVVRDETGGGNRLLIDTSGHITMPSQSSAQSRPAANITDVTGDATTYYSQQGNGASGTTTYTDIFDQNLDMLNGTFTAPVTGRYLVCINVEFDDVASNHSSGVFYINTSNRNYQRLFQPRNMSNVGINCGVPMTQIVDADANDVIRWALYVNGGSKQINITTNTNFGVHLLS